MESRIFLDPFEAEGVQGKRGFWSKRKKEQKTEGLASAGKGEELEGGSACSFCGKKWELPRRCEPHQ